MTEKKEENRNLSFSFKELEILKEKNWRKKNRWKHRLEIIKKIRLKEEQDFNDTKLRLQKFQIRKKILDLDINRRIMNLKNK